MLIRNTIANFAGQLLYPLLALALVPFYIRHLGIEGYGLIGVIAMVVSVLGVFSRGLGSALQREFGRRSGTTEGRRSLRTLLRSFEVVYWALGAALAGGLGLLAVTLGSRWIQAETIPDRIVVACLGLLAVRVALAFPHSIYQSVFIGTERQVRGNVLNALLAVTSAAAGVAAILIFHSVLAFYVSEVVCAGVFLVVLRYSAFAALPDGPAAVDLSQVRALLVASTDLIWTNGIGLLFSSLDRVMVSAMLPVAALAVYTAAASAARAVGLGMNPFLMAAYPRSCRVAATGSLDQQRQNLLRAAAVVAALGAAVAVPLSAFSVDVLRLWLRDGDLARAGAPVVSIHVLGSLLIGFGTVLYQWQMATGATRFGARFNALALLWFPAALWVLVLRHGLAGAAMAWFVYALAAWGYHMAITFRPAALGPSTGRAYLGIVGAAVGPVVAIVAVARLAVDRLFPAPEARLIALLAATAASALWSAYVTVPRLSGAPQADAPMLST